MVLDNSKTAVKNIERALSSARRYRRSVYIELPRDTVSAAIPPIPEDNDTDFQASSAKLYYQAAEVGGGASEEEILLLCEKH